MNKIQFNIFFRNPKYPVIVISGDVLYSAFEIDELASCCISSIPREDENHIKVIDSSGEEFWYSPKHYALSPGLSFRKWTKKSIIELYNKSINAQLSEQSYSLKSISSKRLGTIVKDISDLLRP